MTTRLRRRGQAAGGSVDKGTAAQAAGLLRGWIASGHCFYCHLPLEAWHPVPGPVRHISDKTPYGECRRRTDAVPDNQ